MLADLMGKAWRAYERAEEFIEKDVPELKLRGTLHYYRLRAQVRDVKEQVIKDAPRLVEEAVVTGVKTVVSAVDRAWGEVQYAHAYREAARAVRRVSENDPYARPHTVCEARRAYKTRFGIYPGDVPDDPPPWAPVPKRTKLQAALRGLRGEWW